MLFGLGASAFLPCTEDSALPFGNPLILSTKYLSECQTSKSELQFMSRVVGGSYLGATLISTWLIVLKS